MSVDDEYVWFLPSADLFSGIAQRAFTSFDACRDETQRRGEDPAYIQKMPRDVAQDMKHVVDR